MTAMTVTELTKRILPEVSEAELAAAARQLRYWTLEQIFPTIDYASIKTGSGRHREYDERTIHLAAVAVEIGSRWRLSAELLRRVMVGIHVHVGVSLPTFDKFKINWNDAIGGKPGMFLVLQVPRTSAAPQIVLDLVGLSEVEGYLKSEPCVSTIVVNLSSLFARLRS
jgi:hypothetical protein